MRPRQHDGEHRAALGPVLGADLSALQLDEMLCDREPESGAARIARARFVDAVEALEDARQILFRNARALVRHRHGYPAVETRRLDANRRLLGSVRDRVGHEISEGVVQLG